MKKKEQAVELGVALSGLEEIELLLTYNEDKTSQDKGWIFDSSSTVHVCSQKELFNSLVAREEGIIKMVDGSAARLLTLGQSRLQKRWDGVCSENGPVYPGGTL